MTEATKYRKKPVEIEAIRYTGENGAEIGLFVGAADRNAQNQFLIHTLEGTMAADPGDWIIKGIQGEFYPCKPDIFEATYDKVDGPIEATTYRGYGGTTYDVGDRVKDWYGRRIGTVTKIYKKSSKSVWYITLDMLGKADTIEVKAADCVKVCA